VAKLLAVLAVGAESLLVPDWPMFTEALAPISLFHRVAPMAEKSKPISLVGLLSVPRLLPGTSES